MASFEELKAGIGKANGHADKALIALLNAHTELEKAIAEMAQVTKGSGNPTVGEVNGLLASAAEATVSVQTMVAKAYSTAAEVASRL